ncbi:DNA replication/repair protein RecF [Alteromonas gilva]|uniref:DNA replication and repair protein RecF n=1 Tax=Alteromonas gilva TaxID=2987522 RepID=A0ABT5KX04_9ALTE|nr:DNA replication/repair protein RecF [Alteromonas gilva]MDC8829157.1 DNA replication/repair protein RecF [Alteromonas gilva]
MILDKVQLTQFRNFDSVQLLPSPTLSIITGKNGSGKSSLLEALHYLGYGRSFRTSKHQSVVQHNCDAFTIFANCISEGDKQYKIGLSRGHGEQFKCSVNGEHFKRLTDLVSLLPIQLFTPQSTDLVIGSPSERRRFCDWGLFHVEQSYADLIKQFTKVLRHRNALLKDYNRDSREFDAGYWDQQFIVLSERIDALRLEYVNKLIPIFKETCLQFLPEFLVEISYYRGWDKDTELSEVLRRKHSYDQKVGYTSAGPHKADLRFKVDKNQAQEVLSRGQLRMAVAALQLAQTKLFTLETNRHSIFLLDDIGAELDADKRERFIDGLIETQTQVFVTAIEQEQLEFVNKYKDKKMFHVEHGSVNEE